MASIRHTRVTSTNDSDAVVLTNSEVDRYYEILNVHVAYTSSADVGNRQIVLTIQDASDVLVYDSHAGNVQAASLTYHYEFMRGVYRETTVTALSLQCPMPLGTVLLPGYDLRISDSAAIAATADDMVINVVYKALFLDELKNVN